MPGPLIPAQKVEQLVREGKSNKDILKWLEEHEGIVITRQGLSAFKTRRGINDREMVPNAVPWTLRPEHASLEAARAIRWYSRRMKGLPNPPRDEQRLDRVIERLREQDAVIHYEPDLDEGFVLVPRRPGIDLGIVREPDGDRTPAGGDR